jgi:hypothetical protein
VNRHLSVFLPYDRPPQHEDQLTRAAMIVMRAVPLARDALLARLGAPTSARLPEPELDMQTNYVMAPALVAEPDGGMLHELISVFLSPDEGLNLSQAQIAERARGQRLDGVLRFGDQLVVVIECKTVPRAPTGQAEELRRRGVEVEHSQVVALGWHELLEDWWALLERGLLAPAEQVLMEDLVAFAEEHFPHLLPFTTLGSAGGHDLRRRRRLVALLREATGLNEVEPTRGPVIGATLMLDAVIGTQSTQRIVHLQRNDSLVLVTWPAELKPKPRPYIEPAGHRGSSTSWQHTPAPGSHGPPCTSPSTTPPSPSASTRTVTSTPPTTSAAGQERTSIRSARTPTTAFGRACGPGCANANTPAPKMTRSSTHSFIA